MSENVSMTAAKDPGLRVQVEAALDTLRPYLEADGG